MVRSWCLTKLSPLPDTSGVSGYNAGLDGHSSAGGWGVHRRTCAHGRSMVGGIKAEAQTCQTMPCSHARGAGGGSLYCATSPPPPKPKVGRTQEMRARCRGGVGPVPVVSVGMLPPSTQECMKQAGVWGTIQRTTSPNRKHPVPPSAGGGGGGRAMVLSPNKPGTGHHDTLVCVVAWLGLGPGLRRLGLGLGVGRRPETTVPVEKEGQASAGQGCCMLLWG